MIYSSSKYLEARARMLNFSKNKSVKKEPKEEVEDVMLMKEILGKRIQEVEDGLAPDDFVKTISQIATDLRAYYRLSNCPEDFAYAFTDYLSALDDFVELAMNRPKEVNAEEAFATVLIWTLAGGNPLEPALINESVNAEWQRKGEAIQKRISEAEKNLNRIAIKYGLRL